MSNHNLVADDAALAQMDILCRLRTLEEHVQGTARIIEADAPCKTILDQLVAVQSALETVQVQLIQRHLSCCLSALLKSLAPAEQQQALAELVRLYQFVCRHKPQISGKEVVWQQE